MNKIIYYFYYLLKVIKYKYPVNPLKIFKFLQESQYWTKDEIKSYQCEKINNLLKKVKNSSIYYQKSLSGINLPISSLDAFYNDISLITKEIIKKNSAQLKTTHHSSRYKRTTSGSSGDPLSVYISSMAEVYRKAGVMRFKSWWGIKPNDKSVLIWGFKNTNTKKPNFLGNIKRKLRNRYDINVFNLNKKTIYDFYKDIEEFKPSYIRGYKSAILQFAELLDNNGLIFKNFRFKVAIVTSEVLMESEREYIKNTLNCKVANEYGAVEAGLFAYECPHGSMHINEESVYIYTDKNNNIFVTELYNHSMPLINYKIDDVVNISDRQCSCGRTSRLINKIEGRLCDYVIKPDGSKISQYIFYYIIKELDDIGFRNSIIKYKIIQQQNCFIFNIIPDKGYKNAVKDYIRKRMYKEIGKTINIKFKIVDNIRREKGGKLRFFVREE